jgi:anti-sigma regulatory factor (Ser/Thr protein kinase)
MTSDNEMEVVCIAVPPLERMNRVVHLATTAVASRTGLNIDQADDINTALDELFRLSVSQPGAKQSFCVRYDIHDDRLEVVAEKVQASIGDGSSKVSRYRRFIIEKVADRFEERSNPDGGFDVLLVKFVGERAG